MKKKAKSAPSTKISKLLKKIKKSKFAFLLASPIILVVAVIVTVGTVSAAVVVTHQIVTSEQVAKQEMKTLEKEDDIAPVAAPEENKDEDYGGYILDGVKTEDMLMTIEKHANTKNNGFGMTAEQVKLSESKEAIEGRLRSLGIKDYTISGKPGNYRVDIRHTINISQVACDAYPDQSDTAKKRDLADYYLMHYMPASLRSGSITFTIKGDKLTPTQTFYWDVGNGWTRWNEDGGSYMTCNPPQVEE